MRIGVNEILKRCTGAAIADASWRQKYTKTAQETQGNVKIEEGV